VVNRHKPCRLSAASTPIPLMTWPPHCPGSTLVSRLNQETVHDFVLFFLPPCGPHLIPLGHRVLRADPTCPSTPRRPHMLRPFAPALHLHLRKSIHNLHLQYSAKSQSTPCCQSLITPRSDHPQVLTCSVAPVGEGAGWLPALHRDDASRADPGGIGGGERRKEHPPMRERARVESTWISTGSSSSDATTILVAGGQLRSIGTRSHAPASLASIHGRRSGVGS
jgi:hypothetical protein